MMVGVPTEPPPTPWRLPNPRRTDEWGLVGIGADLEPGTLLAAYRRGTFPMPVDGTLGWFSPDPRAILPIGARRRRSVRRARARYLVRVDTAFEEVLEGCADPGRPGGWITAEMRRAYRDLRDLGWAHSVEAWTPDGHLAGGLFGIAIGGFFAAESMFHSLTDGSKAAVAGLVEILAAAPHADARLLDVQWTSAHLATLGVLEVTRTEYLTRLEAALVLPDPFG
jgi:leucyl/phenylalanyl-tRNA--protein transferase